MTTPTKETVLIAEDERSIRSLLRMILESEGYLIREAANGEETLDALQQNPPDVLLLDLAMPPPQGMDVLRYIRNSTLKRKPAVVILTAHGSVQLAVEAIKLGALDFVEKPVTPEHLLEILTRIRSEKNLTQDKEADTYEAILARARIALSGGELITAEGLLLRAAPLGDKDPAYHNLLGLLTELQGKFDAARKHYGAAIRLNKKFEPAQQNMRRLYELREFGHSDEPGAL